jgi:hypothetical protein
MLRPYRSQYQHKCSAAQGRSSTTNYSAFAVALLAVRSLLIMHRRVRLCIGIYVVCRLYECVREKKQQDAKNDADHRRITVLIAAIQSMHARTSFTS